MTTPEMKDVEAGDAIEALHGWINELDHEQLAGLYSKYCEDADVAIRVVDGGGDGVFDDSSNWHMAGKCMQVQLIPVEGGE